MSLHLEFEPHSWYMGFAIKKEAVPLERDPGKIAAYFWHGYTDNGNTYQVDTITELTLAKLKQSIKAYRQAERERMARLYHER